MLYNVVLVFAVQQHESAVSVCVCVCVCVCVSPFSFVPPTHPPHPIPLGHQRVLSQITNDIFHRSRTVCLKTQKTLNSQCNLEKEKQTWRNQLF